MRPRDLPTGLVTFLFTDIEGSTRLSERAGDGFASLIDRHHALLRAALAANDGLEVSTEGDAFFAVFESPSRAVAAAVDAQRAIAAEPWPEGVDVRVRMGVHAGDAQLGGDSYAGYDVNRAARISGAAHGGQVLLSAALRDLVAADLPAGVEIRSLGDHRLRDIGRPEPIHQLVIDGLPDAFPPLRADRPGWLPEPVTTFLGRETEIAEVVELLRRARCVTLIGPGGMGKTRLSIEAARAAAPDFPAGTWFVALEAVRAPELVIPAIAAALAIAEEVDRPLVETLGARIGERGHLLVLDNFEQVVAAGPRLGDLIRAAPGLRILVSSREVLRIAGEQVYDVAGLEAGTAVRLFLDRARQVRPGLEPDAVGESAIAELVDRLDRLPLAIELAAARTNLFAPPALLARLRDRLSLLDSGARDLPERQRTLHGAISWSCELLDAADTATFERFSAFQAGADLAAAEAVLDVDGKIGDVLGRIASLTEKSMLRRDDGPDGEPRFRMLDTIHDFAARRLEADPTIHARIRERHAGYFLAWAEAISPAFEGTEPAASFARAELEHDNLRAAMDWSLAAGQPALGLRIGGALWRFWQNRGHLADGRARLEALLAHPAATADASARGRGLRAVGSVRYWQGEYQTAHAAYAEATWTYRTTDDLAGLAGALLDLSYTTGALGEPARSAELLEEAVAIYDRLGDADGAYQVRVAIVVSRIWGRDWAGAWAAFDRLLAETRIRGRPWELADRLGLGTIIALLVDDVVAARRLYDEGEAQSEGAGLPVPPNAVEVGAHLAAAEGRPEAAARLLGALQRHRDEGELFLAAPDLLGFDRPEPAVRVTLGDAYDEHFEAGRRLTLEEARDADRRDREATASAGTAAGPAEPGPARG